MLTLGVDLASQAAKTAACLIEWSPESARVETLELGVGDERLLRLAEAAEKVGIDVPFGWPDDFVDAVSKHHHGQAWPEVDGRPLRYRRTDLVVWERTGRPPLSVSSDRIAVPAFRAARLLSSLSPDRSGGGKFVEVYPRAARACFALGRSRSLSELRQRMPRLDLDEHSAAICEQSDDVFDALIASLVARASALGLCEAIPAAEREAAAREGWIALPLPDALDRLSG